MHVRPESVTHLVVKLFNVKSKFDYIDKNLKKSEIVNNDKFEKKNCFGNNFFLLCCFFKGRSVKGETNLILI
jgi:hypothetical protein